MGKRKSDPLSGQQIVSTSSTFTNFPTFFLVKRSSTSNDNFHTVSPFLVEKAIIATVGEVKSTKKLQSGDLLVEVHSRKQSQQIVKLKTFSNIPKTVYPHASLNSSKGVITCGELLNVPTEEILKELQGQGVSHVRRISIRRDGQLLNTKHLILTFDSAKLPENIKAGYMRLSVRTYIPNPLRCFKCQRFGHSKTSCRGTLTCARCAEVEHESTDCTRTEKCVNCKGEHTSFSRNCIAWKREKEIISTKIKKQISYPEARKLVNSQTTTPGNSYVSVAKKSFSEPSVQKHPDASAVTCSKPSDSTAKASPPMTNLPIPSSPSVVPVSEEALASPDFTDFKVVRNRKKLKKDSPTKTNHSITKAEKIAKFYTTSRRETTNPIPTKYNTSNLQSTLKRFPTTTPTSVDIELLPMAVLPPLEKILLQSRESDADAGMSSSSASDEDALEYNMSEDLKDSPAVISPPPPSKPDKANKYKNTGSIIASLFCTLFAFKKENILKTNDQH
ncbi:hypothetical protein AVEN_147696-1 [Araneus ventricosus]|uniref:CCHC-type domain-containing protein n=1 Tax=Araneus ventricosus TaxID=182803 RepID=A0A4Y2UZY9_ARAVE|nr:hypothetical protein AVEN_193982-1 [Araneus ventricosus]GBO17831.1 hypothetical protein AVEN_147696-1 [Araneus ventricosus]